MVTIPIASSRKDRLARTRLSHVAVKIPMPNAKRHSQRFVLNSDAWWVVYDEIETENDRQLTTKLAICRGCIGRNNEATGSVR